jgi:alkylated DNA repair dioxygenase AlkB
MYIKHERMNNMDWNEKAEVTFFEHLHEIVTAAKAKNPVQQGMLVPNGIIDQDWLYIEDFLCTEALIQDSLLGKSLGKTSLEENEDSLLGKSLGLYEIFDKEISPFLTIGFVKLFGSLHQERRQTTYFSLDNAIMRYSGRTLEPNTIPADSILQNMFNLVNGPNFRILMQTEYGYEMPRFNAAFINKYRSPKELQQIGTDKCDSLGWHAQNGERVFEFRPKRATSGVSRQIELKNMSCLIMLPGCQARWKHRVADRVTRLDGGYVTGARYNITFRSLSAIPVPK